MADRTAQDQDKFIVRLPDGMRDRIRRAADAANRSMNAEIVAALEEKYPVPRTDMTSWTMREWIDYVLSVPEGDERLRRVGQFDAVLAADPKTRHTEVRIVYQRDEEAGDDEDEGSLPVIQFRERRSK